MNRSNGGVWVDRPRYSEGAYSLAIAVIQKLRPEIKLDETNAERGRRFNDDVLVFIRLESMANELEFARTPVGWVAKALRDAAQSDYWYNHEKRYDYFEETGSDEESDD